MTNNKQQTEHRFCLTPELKCTMSYCDENGCINRQRHLGGDPIEMTNNKQQTAMKKLLLATLLIGMVSGCTEPTVKSTTTKHTIPSEGNLASDPLKVCVIEGCQYFICKNHKGNILCHKGNCKNIIHWR